MSKQVLKQVSPHTSVWVDEEDETMNNKKQSSIEWLQEQLKKGVDFNPLDKNSYLDNVEKIFEQAKAMQKQQSITDYCEGFKASGEGWNGEYGLTDMLNVAEEINAEQYYNETFGDEKVEVVNE